MEGSMAMAGMSPEEEASLGAGGMGTGISGPNQAQGLASSDAGFGASNASYLSQNNALNRNAQQQSLAATQNGTGGTSTGIIKMQHPVQQAGASFAKPSPTQIGTKLFGLTPGGAGDQMMQANQASLNNFVDQMRNNTESSDQIKQRLFGRK